MHKDDTILAIIMVVICFVTFVLGAILGRDALRKEAVHNGLAHWTTTESGSVSFHWNTNLVVPKVITHP